MKIRTLLVAGVSCALAFSVTTPPMDAAVAAKPPGTYHVDCSQNKAGNGKIQKPYNSIEQLPAQFQPGERILFKKDTSCEGSLQPTGSGTADLPIVIGSYGQGARPVLRGGTEKHAPAAIVLRNQSHWQVADLELTGGYWQNLLVVADQDNTVMEGLSFSNLSLHDNAWEPPFAGWIVGTGGLVIQPCRYTASIRDITIDNVESYNQSESGIHMGYSMLDEYDPVNEVGSHNAPTCFMSDLGDRVAPRTGIVNAVIKNSHLHHNDASGTQIFSATDVLVDGNELDHNGGGAGMNGEGAWWGNTTRLTAQYNSAHSNIRGRTGHDGSGLDADFRTDDNLIQYNYLSNNDAYGFSVIAGKGASRNSVVRYNVFAGNGQSTIGAPDIMVSSPHPEGIVDGLDIYNNTMARNTQGQAIRLQSRFEGDQPNLIRNNLIYRGQPSTMISTTTPDADLDHNVYFTPNDEPAFQYNQATYQTLAAFQTATEQDAESRVGNPYLNDWTYAKPERPSPFTFSLKPESVALGAGAVIPGNGGLDFYGNPVSDAAVPHIGAYNGPVR
ncbi:right-handed parallel beta-helix repeat-containing protein [Cryobacterium sp. N19]|uniref:right-handed parallel beta-helix repeat-containing protein n=1 Tax=Cryobacterium sp. N19 TaxID=2048288 RepID=UPI000CE481D7|nr:right-handed parallel beta-helix repeat-containing protein [Cryobacterium sp. N19]